MRPIPGIQIRQVLFLLIIAVVLFVIFWNLRGFLPALLGAYALYVLLERPLHYLTERRRWPRVLAAATLMLLSFAAIVLPLNWLIRTLGGRLVNLVQESPDLLDTAAKLIRDFEAMIGIKVINPENIQSLTTYGLSEAQHLLNATLNGLAMLLVAYLVLYFLLTAGKDLEHWLFNWLPLRAENAAYVRQQLNDLVYSNALGIPLMGLVQGLAGLAAYWVAGVEDLAFWFGITFISGMMPIVGAALAYIPLSLILLSQGMPVQALLIFLYGFFIIGSVDNVARMWLLKKIGHTHPLVTFFGVIMGLKLFGFVGFIFGPILIAGFFLFVKVYVKEFGNEAPAAE